LLAGCAEASPDFIVEKVRPYDSLLLPPITGILILVMTTATFNDQLYIRNSFF
jgi:hypothetical protein